MGHIYILQTQQSTSPDYLNWFACNNTNAVVNTGFVPLARSVTSEKRPALKKNRDLCASLVAMVSMQLEPVAVVVVVVVLSS